MIQIRPDDLCYDDRHYLRVDGRSGLFAGESVKVSLGESVVIGRSRECQLSLKKTPRFLTDAEGERSRIRTSLAYRAVSRRHVRISYLSPDLVEIENLSPNGTLLDGHLVDRIVVGDVRRRAHEIRLGPHGDSLELACGSVELDASAVPA
jgi:pSer/pThr/pTyr-binding forkhead associated (FHA) protein